MIFDSVAHMDIYFSAVPGLKKVKEILDGGALKKAVPGQYSSGDPLVRYNVMAYATGASKSGNFEIHKKETDVHILLKGAERMELLWRKPLTVTAGYSAKKDAAFVSGKAALEYHAAPGFFALFFPGEPHASALRDGKISEVLKVVFKIRAPGG
ncbi:MAG: YhcH/YjgK/YiaL family protein [Treponema sp.]|jgi:YhcH/YjgK/YiaL family protein|nr:YhcH/YjgK/YiaL family protein [Treponema sp.]